MRSTIVRNTLAYVLVMAPLSLAAGTLPPDTVKTADYLVSRALASSRAHDLLESLTTEVGARLAGTEADHRAVRWAKEILENSVFDRVTLEPVRFPVWQRECESARIVEPFPQNLIVTALGFSPSTAGEIVAPVISFSTLEELERASAEDVAGKIVFMTRHVERTRTGNGYGDAAPIRYRSSHIAKKKGAKAVLIRSLGTGPQNFAHTGAMTYDESDPNLPSAAVSIPDADQLERILARGERLVLGLNLQTRLEPDGGSHNVVADLRGRERPDEIVLLGAHLDSWDLGTGALDDGVGVATAISAAEIIASLPSRPRRTIRVVLFANEELGGWGAKQYVEDHSDELPNHMVAAESDLGAGMIWKFDTRVPENLLPVMNEIGAQLEKLGVERGTNDARGGPDLGPLKERGVPIVDLSHDATRYFDFHHTHDDTLNKVDAAVLRRNVAKYVLVGYMMSELEL